MTATTTPLEAAQARHTETLNAVQMTATAFNTVQAEFVTCSSATNFRALMRVAMALQDARFEEGEARGAIRSIELDQMRGGE